MQRPPYGKFPFQDIYVIGGSQSLRRRRPPTVNGSTHVNDYSNEHMRLQLKDLLSLNVCEIR